MNQPLSDGKARTTKELFSRQTTVANNVAAPAEKIWSPQFAHDLKSAAEENA
jgi:hypothetical protein